MTAFYIVGIELNLLSALLLIPVATKGRIIGLKAHDLILQNDELFKRKTGGVLMVISCLGLYSV